jgi:hypothetical protein
LPWLRRFAIHCQRGFRAPSSEEQEVRDTVTPDRSKLV